MRNMYSCKPTHIYACPLLQIQGKLEGNDEHMFIEEAVEG
jgi:hypothetical protein